MHVASYILVLILILILMLKLELPQVMLPRSEAPNAGVQALYVVPAHVGPLGLSLHPPILFPGCPPSSVEMKPIQAHVIVRCFCS